MVREKNPITKSGKEKIEAELNSLIRNDREEIKQAISDARKHGDLKENAEYHSAKEKQAMLEGRIKELQSIMATAEVIDPSVISSETVVFGATVTLYDGERDRRNVYQVVGKSESDTANGKVSITSPIGAALLGKEEGEVVCVRAPKGDIEYEIELIEYR
ncbi:MAG: transcription elongation factor GreA [Bdellovibrionales bacterium]|jgi:transcription elongation factor GreA|nr:transcription elongation factor GreA [Bdellovibrionales bacterium]MBT3527071.1 transcription elongation factor GreA [Bdellovibrionales bacterium]MBT7670531.1 transcription elongation factor GreA [Bdellovibrionales bacterium]MBT7766457.1 transcription elongation factor GreA [Bdellovibrionales bacterium]